MTILSKEINLDDFFARLALTEKNTLLLDYDGTLAPLVPDRDRAFPYLGIAQELEAIMRSTRTRVVIVSGRTVNQVKGLLKVEPTPEIWGCHGWEHYTREGQYELSLLPQELVDILREARRRIVAVGLQRHLEEKPVSIAVHWRGEPDLEVKSIRRTVVDQWQDLQQRGILEFQEFNGGLEMRPRLRTKGTVVSEIVASERDQMVAYLGDDATDEDAFAALDSRALKVLVRDSLRSTLADVWLEPPAELFEFLRRWRAAASAAATRCTDDNE
jgi:trehalose 6-phosphate phosphatase